MSRSPSRPPVLVLLLLAASCGRDEAPTGPDPAVRAAALREVEGLLDRLDEPEVVDRIAGLGVAGPLLGETAPDREPRQRRLAMLALGRCGGPEARDRLLELLYENTGDPVADGATHLYAAAGLTLRADPGTAIDLLLRLGANNPDDNIAALASEDRSEPYATVDAQICEALLAMGVWGAEEDLVAQLRRRHRIRVLIDAHAVLRRWTGLALPFRYNGSYDDRNGDADAWQAALRETRAERRAARPFASDDPRFRARCADVIAWLGGQSVNNRLIAHKVLTMCGPPAVPQLVEALRSGDRVMQRQAALVLGRIGDRAAGPALVATLDTEDPDARAQVLTALQALRWREAAAEVEPLLADDDPEVRAAAATYLGALGGTEALDAIRAVRRAGGQPPGTATALAAAAHRLGDPDAWRALLDVFRDGEQIDRAIALRSLREGPPPPAGADAVRGALDGIDALATPKERRAAAERLRALWERR